MPKIILLLLLLLSSTIATASTVRVIQGTPLLERRGNSLRVAGHARPQQVYSLHGISRDKQWVTVFYSRGVAYMDATHVVVESPQKRIPASYSVEQVRKPFVEVEGLVAWQDVMGFGLGAGLAVPFTPSFLANSLGPDWHVEIGANLLYFPSVTPTEGVSKGGIQGAGVLRLIQSVSNTFEVGAELGVGYFSTDTAFADPADGTSGTASGLGFSAGGNFTYVVTKSCKASLRPRLYLSDGLSMQVIGGLDYEF